VPGVSADAVAPGAVGPNPTPVPVPIIALVNATPAGSAAAAGTVWAEGATVRCVEKDGPSETAGMSGCTRPGGGTEEAE